MRRLLPVLLSTVLAAVVGTVAAPPAWGHTRLVSSTPAVGASAEAPRQVVLAFSDAVQPGLSAVSVTGADGQEHASGSPSAGGDDRSVSQALRSPLEPGTYRVAYRVLAADGHPVTGAFELTALAPPVAPAAASDAPLPTASASAGGQEGTSTPALRPASDEADEESGLPVLPLVVVGLVVAGAAGVVGRRLGGVPPRT